MSLKPGEANLGTTIMAVVFDNGVVVGADSRTTTGSYISNRITNKLTEVHDRIFCCRSGSASDTEAVIGIVHYYLQMYAVQYDERPSVHTCATLFQDLTYKNKEMLSAGFIIAGWDKHKGANVWNISLGGALVQQSFAISGSGSTYIYGYCDSAFKENMTRDECLTFVQNSVSLAMARDGSSGGMIHTAVIDANGVEHQVLPGNKLPYNL